MISPEAQLKKQSPEVWGDGTVLNMDKLTESMQARFLNSTDRKFSPKRKDIQDKALMEIAPQYMINLADDFRKEIINK